VLMSPFVPMIFQGEEWAASSPFQYFADHDDPELARAVSEGRKREFQAFGWKPDAIPDPEKVETYLQSKLKWEEANDGRHAQMQEWYRRLIDLRRSTRCLNDGEPGNTRVIFNETDKWLSMQRGQIQLHCNLGQTDHQIELGEGTTLVMASCESIRPEDSRLSLPPDAVAILKRGGGSGNSSILY
jgi:maltooligosyltrehalose trehalohydrolase